MAVGIKYGSNEAGREKQAKAYAYAGKLHKQFEMRHGTVLCRDLIKYNLSNPDEAVRARQEKVFDKVCVDLIRECIINFLELEK